MKIKHSFFEIQTSARLYHWDQYWQSGKNRFSNYYRERLAKLYSLNISDGATILEIGCGDGELLSKVNQSKAEGIDFSKTAIAIAKKNNPQLTFHVGDAVQCQLPEKKFDYIILSDLLNDTVDVQLLFENLQNCCTENTKIICNYHNSMWFFPIKVAEIVGLASPKLNPNWLAKNDVENFAATTGFEVLKHWSDILIPFYVPFLSSFTNRYLSKIYPFSLLNVANFCILKASKKNPKKDCSVSIIVAARNEEGNIKELIERTPTIGTSTELIFVEGNSSDNTFEEIKSQIKQNPKKNIRLFKQDGKGKGNAVRKGFEKASGELLMILDADMTVPPENLENFYKAYLNSGAEFVNGVRLVYPMEEEAMRFLNLLGNKFFSSAFSWLLDQPIKDTLCGTKVLSKTDYDLIAENRHYFGNFDPFGDFDLLFGAAKLNLHIIDLPIRYQARKYGDTNISRWSHGWLLLRMVLFAAKKLKFAK